MVEGKLRRVKKSDEGSIRVGHGHGASKLHLHLHGYRFRYPFEQKRMPTILQCQISSGLEAGLLNGRPVRRM